MAWTANKTLQGSEYIMSVVLGNGQLTQERESHMAGEFQSSLTRGRDLNKRVAIENTVAVLGTRQDYFKHKLVLELTALGITDTEPVKESFYVDVWDYTSVPADVQYSLFGKYSPFETPTRMIPASYIKGITKQHIGFSNVNSAGAGFPAVDATATTVTTCYVRGAADARFTAAYSQADPTGGTTLVDYAYVKMLPNSDGVLLIAGKNDRYRPAATLWMAGQQAGNDIYGETAT